MNATKVLMTIRHDADASLSLWLNRNGLGEHRAAYEFAENRDHADFYRRVDQLRRDYKAQGIEVTFVDETR
jgi:hypothetical protein